MARSTGFGFSVSLLLSLPPLGLRDARAGGEPLGFAPDIDLEDRRVAEGNPPLYSVTCAPGEAGAVQPVEDRCR